MSKVFTKDNIDDEIIKKLNHIEMISLKDGLTGLWNKEYLIEKIRENLVYKKNVGTLFLIDIDNFSKINRELGHIVGDSCLVRLSKLLKNSFRERDVVARISDDEFAIFIIGNITNNDINTISQKLIKKISTSFREMELGREFNISIGIAKSPSSGTDFLSLYKTASTVLNNSRSETHPKYTITEDEEKIQAADNVDMQIVRELIAKSSKPDGALNVENEGLRHIFQFIKRYSSRQETEIDIILFTLSNESTAIDPGILQEAMYELENIIKTSLRIGDVATKYSSCQYLVMLIGAKKSTAKEVAKRVAKNCKDLEEKYEMQVKFDMDTEFAE